AARPGRVDLAVEISLPDEDARRRLIDLYGRGLEMRLSDVNDIVSKTEGVAASFIKELIRKSALMAAERSSGDGTITVTDTDTADALEELLTERSKLTRVLLGGRGRGQEGGAVPMGPAPIGLPPGV